MAIHRNRYLVPLHQPSAEKKKKERKITFLPNIILLIFKSFFFLVVISFLFVLPASQQNMCIKDCQIDYKSGDVKGKNNSLMTLRKKSST